MTRFLVLEGEVVHIDDRHRWFTIFRRDESVLCAYRSFYDNVRGELLLGRKHELRRIIGEGLLPIIYADHIEGSEWLSESLTQENGYGVTVI